mmetsp:Transcript_27679/g.60953  ORF Transcript_27679/g.60953 Transcript_27679/m.60953 type:complete len:511 (+) Transcript_27679:96-1628(+)
MGEVDFEMSSQAKFWMFDEAALLECREKACNNISSQSRAARGKPRVRKFACGYNGRKATKSTATTHNEKPPKFDLPTTMTPEDQETLIHFHAHQIQKLIGPNAIFPLLQTRGSVLSTAIMLFRKFYLSNSVIDFHPRNIAAASALLAVKTDCEPNLPIDLLSHATFVVEMRAQNDPLSMDELRGVTIQEIEAAERVLLEGCDYRLRSHHPYGAIKVLASDVFSHFMHSREQNDAISDYVTCSLDDTGGSENVYASPRSAVCEHQSYRNFYNDDHLGLDTLRERALSIAQSALVYSDINFLFQPGQIAFAAVALALDSHAYNYDDDCPTCNRLGTKMREYMCVRFSQKSEEEISEYEKEVSKIISTLEHCSAIDLEMFSPFWQFHQRRYEKTAEREAIKIRKAIFTASRLRVVSRSTFQVATSLKARSPSPPPFGYHHHRHEHYPSTSGHAHHYQHRHFNQQYYDCDEGQRKRGRDEEDAWTPEHHHNSYSSYQHNHNKIARVTPVNIPLI